MSRNRQTKKNKKTEELFWFNEFIFLLFSSNWVFFVGFRLKPLQFPPTFSLPLSLLFCLCISFFLLFTHSLTRLSFSCLQSRSLCLSQLFAFFCFSLSCFLFLYPSVQTFFSFILSFFIFSNPFLMASAERQLLNFLPIWADSIEGSLLSTFENGKIIISRNSCCGYF